MRTEDLIDLLARGAGSEAMPRPGRLWAAGIAGGSLAVVAVMLAVLGLQADLAAKLSTLAWWGKAGFAFAVAVPALVMLIRLGRPPAPSGRWSTLCTVPNSTPPSSPSGTCWAC